MAHIVKTLHVTPVEYAVIRAAADALEMELSRLVLEGVLEEAHRMGFFVGVEPPIRRRPDAWTDLPDRRETSTSLRLSVSYSLTTFDLLHRVAAHVRSATRCSPSARRSAASRISRRTHPRTERCASSSSRRSTSDHAERPRQGPRWPG